MSFGNHLLEALGPDDREALRPHLTRVDLVRGERFNDPGQILWDVYLPIDCILSLIIVMRDGAQVESRTIGRESGYGLLNALGSSISHERMEVQVSGRAWRLSLERLRQASIASPALSRIIAIHAQATIVQSAQGAACNALHAVEARLCKWLLLTRDRLGSDLLPLTQEHLGIMLGVQRTTVTAAASALQARGAISYARGKITVLDAGLLLRCACECYEAVTESARALVAELPAQG